MNISTHAIDQPIIPVVYFFLAFSIQLLTQLRPGVESNRRERTQFKNWVCKVLFSNPVNSYLHDTKPYGILIGCSVLFVCLFVCLFYDFLVP